ncbi:SMI1/KNR4 family protein [Burkholderia glumae]|uniref:SMI1/KNR4 family protein n=1 Tax=Burkholderia glumae TaxID=337 RepID=A0ABY5BCY6_BURGL|nr:SMI1/KNR4 family protein [Burkholderia glumae]USS44380.1 SMI1/KNR4 family protein [Burkholderia glumae]
MQFEDTSKPLSDEEIRDFEKKARVKLPEAFKRHYITYNGGYPVDAEAVEGIEHTFPLHGFFPLTHGSLTIESVKKDLAEDFGLTDAIPFAYDQGSNIFYISTSEANFGAVFQITAETRDRFLVTESFEDFLEGLRSVQ